MCSCLARLSAIAAAPPTRSSDSPPCLYLHPLGMGERSLILPPNSAPRMNGMGGWSAPSACKHREGGREGVVSHSIIQGDDTIRTLVLALRLEDATPVSPCLHSAQRPGRLQTTTHSKKLRPAACTSTSTWPSAGLGAATSELGHVSDQRRGAALHSLKTYTESLLGCSCLVIWIAFMVSAVLG